MTERTYRLGSARLDVDVLADVLRWVAARYACWVQVEASAAEVASELAALLDSARFAPARIPWDQLSPGAWRGAAALSTARPGAVVLVEAGGEPEKLTRLACDGACVSLVLDDGDEAAFAQAFPGLPLQGDRSLLADVVPPGNGNPALAYGRWVWLQVDRSRGRAPLALVFAGVACGIGASLVAGLVTDSQQLQATTGACGMGVFGAVSAGCAIAARWGRRRSPRAGAGGAGDG